MLTGVASVAEDFTITNEEGITLGFEITSASDLTVAVTSMEWGDNDINTNVVIPETVEYGSHTFAVTYMRSLTGKKPKMSITIPPSIQMLGSNVFINTHKIKFHVSDIDSWSKLCRGGDTGISDYYLYIDGKQVTDLVVPDTWTEIPNNAFAVGLNVETVYIHDGVTAIGSKAFYYATVEEIRFPNNPFYIADDAFTGCKMSSLEIPDFATIIANQAFYNCTELQSVSIGNSVERIGKRAFGGCKALTDLTIGNGVTEIGNGAFEDCISLKTVIIPNSVTKLGSGVFSACEALESVTIGEGLANIGVGDVFKDCNNIKQITCLRETPPAALGDFTQKLYLDATLYVPQGTGDAYRNADVWKNFYNIEEKDFTNDQAEYSVSVTVGKGGKVVMGEDSVSDGRVVVTYNEGDDVSLTITPDKGYKLSSVMVNGTDVTNNVKSGIYTLEDLHGDTGIAVAFEPVVYEREDVNEDGQINTADVVSIYNRIINGKQD